MKQCLLAYSLLLSACIPGRLRGPDDQTRRPKPVSISDSRQDFNRIPDGGAVFSIQLFVRLAVRHHPQRIFNPLTGSVGHVFLALKKVNGQDSTLRYFGFYPKSGFPGVFNRKPVAATLADDGNHRCDAGLQIIVTPDEFSRLLVQAQIMAGNIFYQTYQYNCVDFAVGLINQVKTPYPLKIRPRRHSLLPASCHTPEDLYQLIKNKN